MTELRDLEADRRFVKLLNSESAHGHAVELWRIADAALDEIARLKRLLVQPNRHGGFFAYCGREVLPYPTEADAWAAVRKEAMG